ncbi:hypothetical protein [Campylobacter geochelonis]|uniref:hypothetical protein n=1 Tax=Campylobacter geochelonis TaxID=1780362 RepID=UPI0007709F64|nr:hypothetical protein [Campylobacter geochelonis]CZE50984.1 plasminogen-binding protein PgbB [Campylobacter geochelonis]
MKKNVLITAVLASLLLAGCSTKRQYFSPQDEEIKGEVSYEYKLPDNIAQTTINGATLKDGTIVTKNGVFSGFKLEKGEKFLGEFDGKFASSNLNGNFKLRDSAGNILLENDFDEQVVSASINGDDLALVSADNAIYLIKISSNKTVLAQKFPSVFTIDSRTASPLFIEDIIVYPSLDGRLFIVHRASARIMQDMFVSTEPFFNNIIFLDMVGQTMYAATNTNLVLLSPTGNKRLVEDIKDVLRYKDKFYILKKDGVIKVYDLNLNEVAQNKFKFAIYSGVIAKNDSLYIFEKTGYFIKTDLNLQNPQIFELSDEIDDKSFAGSDAFYYDDRYLKLD